MSKDKAWITTPAYLLDCFREGLLALVPVAEKACMRWREPENYDDWDDICSALYDAIVVRSIERATESEHFFAIEPYDLRVESYEGKSFIGNSMTSGDYAFVCFQTKDEPFDTCFFARLDPCGSVKSYDSFPIRETQFNFVGRKTGSSTILNDLKVIL